MKFILLVLGMSMLVGCSDEPDREKLLEESNDSLRVEIVGLKSQLAYYKKGECTAIKIKEKECTTSKEYNGYKYVDREYCYDSAKYSDYYDCRGHLFVFKGDKMVPYRGK